MSTGTDGDYWKTQALPSAHKHALLDAYIPQFAGMTGSHSKRVIYLDGYAGEGRYEDGHKGSAERAMAIAVNHARLPKPIVWTCFFAERKAESAAKLRQVAEEYRARGVDAHVHQGAVEDLLHQAVAAATGLPLFLFLDPCGLGLPFRRLVDLVNGPRGRNWPPTEFLLNFSLEAVRRIGGLQRSDHRNEKSLARLDAVCGGPWWREVEGADGLDTDEAVAAGYALRLHEATGMSVRSIPVRRAPSHKAVYHLVFATRKSHGLWAFGEAAARAQNKWWETLTLTQEEQEYALFPSAELQRPNPNEVTRKAVPQIAANIERLLAAGRPVNLVDHTLDVFGEFYGQVTEPAVRKAVKLLNKEGKTATTGIGALRKMTVHPPT